MRKIIVLAFLSLDGVMQAPGGPEEDESGKFMAKQMKSTDLLLGRKTFDIFAAYWPKHTEMWPGIDEVTKYVVSTNLTQNKTAWKNVTFLKNIEAIKKLKQSEGSDLQVHGSGNLAQTLFKHDLVDELWLKFFPVTLGSGKKLFDSGAIPAAFKLTNSLVTPNGVIFANYERAGEVETGTVGG